VPGSEEYRKEVDCEDGSRAERAQDDSSDGLG
jgi:hypothetical protein